MSLLAEELGIEVVGYQTELYGEDAVDDVDSAVALLRSFGPGDAVLIKGSRVAQLEDVARAYGSATDVQSLAAGAQRRTRSSSFDATSTRRLSSP